MVGRMLASLMNTPNNRVRASCSKKTRSQERPLPDLARNALIAALVSFTAFAASRSCRATSSASFFAALALRSIVAFKSFSVCGLVFLSPSCSSLRSCQTPRTTRDGVLVLASSDMEWKHRDSETYFVLHTP